MPVDARELNPVTDGPLVAPDRTCPACDYSLKGLRIGMRCPECGQPIRSAGGGQRESLTDAPIGYLKSLRFGFALLFWGFTGITIGLLAANFGGGWPARLLAFGCTLAWWLGVFIVTEPRRRANVSREVAGREQKHLRLAARLGQCGWTLGLGLRLLVAAGLIPAGTQADVAGWTAFGLTVVAMASLVPLLILLMDFAHWSSNSELAERLKLAAWSLGSLGVLVITWPVLSIAAQNTSGLIALPLAIIQFAMPLLLILFLATEILFLVCLYQLWDSARWAVRNWAEARARDRRQRERAEREAHAAASQPPAEPVPLTGRLTPGPLAARPPIEMEGGRRGGDPYDIAP